MKEKHKANKKRRESLREALKKKLGNWSPEPNKKPSSNIKTSA